MGEGRRQPTPNPSGGGEDRRNRVLRRSRSKNCKNNFSAQLYA
ncbi:hypothetical protein [Okeania sp. SIO2C2]|nr:hypothetical protein [Okeania sp. SIO2C2]